MEFKDLVAYEFVWRNNGQTFDGKEINLNDAISVPNAGMFLPKVISNIVKEAAEPLLVGTSLRSARSSLRISLKVRNIQSASSKWAVQP